jgi:non-heme chloroperoxidase
MQALKPKNTETAAMSPIGRLTSNTYTTKDETVIYYKDWGTGPAVVFCHGYPLSSDAWENQMMFL